MTIHGLDYNMVSGKPAVREGIVVGIKAAVVGSSQIPGLLMRDVKVALSPGSIKADVRIAPPAGVTVESARSSLGARVAAVRKQLSEEVRTVPNIASCAVGGESIAVAAVAVGTAAPTPAPTPPRRVQALTPTPPTQSGQRSG